MRRFETFLFVLAAGSLLCAPRAWTSEIVPAVITPQGVSAHETFMKNLVSARFAGAEGHAVLGQVESIDKAQNQLTLREEVSGESQTFRVMNPSVLDNLSVGDRVRIHDRDFRQPAPRQTGVRYDRQTGSYTY